MDKELKELVELVEQVESCFPKTTTSAQDIDVATVLLVKEFLGITSEMTIAQTKRETMKLFDHVCGNIMANVERQIIAKASKTFLTRITGESNLN